MMLDLPFRVCSQGSFIQPASCQTQQLSNTKVSTDIGEVRVVIDVSSDAALLSSPHYVIDEAAAKIDLSLYAVIAPVNKPQWHHSCLSTLAFPSTQQIIVTDNSGDQILYQYNKISKTYVAQPHSDYAGCYLKQNRSGQFQWHDPKNNHYKSYSKHGYLERFCDEHGNVLEYEQEYSLYYGKYFLKKIKSASCEYDFEWQGHTSLTINKKHKGKSKKLISYQFENYSYDTLKKIQIFNGKPNSLSFAITYTKQGLIEKYIGHDGRELQIKYNERNITELHFGEKQYFLKIQGQKFLVSNEPTHIEPLYTFSFDSNQKLQSVSRGLLALLNYQWHSEKPNLIEKQTHANNSYTSYGYDDVGRIRSVSEFDSKDQPYKTTLFEYDAHGALSKISTAGEETHFIYSYHENGERYLEYKVDAAGQVEHYFYENKQYSGSEKLFKKYSGAINIESLNEWYQDLKKQTSLQAIKQTFIRNSVGQIESLSLGEAMTNFVRTFSGAILKTTQYTELNELIEAHFKRDNIDRLTETTTGSGNVSHISYDEKIAESDKCYLQQTRVLANGLITKEKYNSAKQLMETEYSDGSFDEYDYDEEGKLYYQQSKEGLIKYYFYDDNGNLKYEINGSGELVFYESNIQTDVYVTTRFSQRLAMDNAIYLSKEDKNKLLSQIDEFAAQHKEDGNNRVQYQIKASSDQVQFEISKATEDRQYIVHEKKYHTNDRHCTDIYYANFLSQAEILALIESRTFPEAKKSIKDRLSLTILHQGEEIAHVDAAGYVTLNTFNGAGLLVEQIQIQNPLSQQNIKRLIFSPTKDILDKFITPESLNQASRTVKYYHANGKLALSVDAKGYVDQYEYDSQNRLKNFRRYAKEIADFKTLSIDTLPELPIEDNEDKVISYQYDADGHCIEEHHVNDNYVITKKYDAVGNQTDEQRQDLLGEISGDTYRAKKTEYDLHGKVKAVVNPLVCLEIKKTEENLQLNKEEKSKQIQTLIDKYSEVIQRDIQQRTIYSSDAIGNKTHYLYGHQNRVACTVSAEGAVTLYEHNAFGEIEKIKKSKTCVDVNSFLALFEDNNFDAAKLAELKDKEGNTVNYIEERQQYNPLGLISAKVDGDGYEQRKRFNAFKEVAHEESQIDDRDFLCFDYIYEARGLVTEKITSKTNSDYTTLEVKEYDNPLGLCTYEKEEDGLELSHEYDGLGRCDNTYVNETNIKTGKKSKVNIKHQQHDAFGRVVKTQTPLEQDKVQSQITLSNRTLRTIAVFYEGHEDCQKVTTNNIFSESISIENEIGVLHQTAHSATGKIECILEQVPNKKQRMIEINTFEKNNLLSEKSAFKGNKSIASVYQHNKDGSLTHEIQNDQIINHYERDALGNIKKHTDALGIITTHEYNNCQQCTQSIIDPQGLGIKTVETFNGLRQRISQEVSDSAHQNSYKVKFDSDNVGRVISKTLDPDGLNITNIFERNRAGHIISELDGNGHKQYKIINEYGKPVIEVSAEGRIKVFEYQLQQQVAYIRHYKNTLKPQQINTLLNENEFKASNQQHNWSNLYAALNEMASVDDKQQSFFYNDQGKKYCELKHFYDHKDKKHKAYIAKYQYSKTLKKTNKTLSKIPIVIEDMSKSESSDHNIKAVAKLKFFSKMDLQNKAFSHQTDPVCDRQTWYFYDESDDLVFTINADGAIRENIYNNQHQIVHTIEYARSLTPANLEALKSKDPEACQVYLKEFLRPVCQFMLEDKSKVKEENLHSHFVFDEYDNPIFSVDPKGLVIRKYFDRQKNIIKEIHFSAPFFLPEHPNMADLDAKLFELYDEANIKPTDRVYINHYDKAHRLECEVDPNGNEDHYERDAADLIVKHTDRNNNVFIKEYDAARRHIADISPDIEVTSVAIEGEGNDAKLVYETVKRSVRDEKHYDKTTMVTGTVHDSGFDERRVFIERDKDDKAIGITSDNIEIDDPLKTPTSLFDRPTILKSIKTSEILNDSGKPLVSIDENGHASFKIYDALDRIVYEVNARGLVTFYQRDDFGHPLISTQYEKALSLSDKELSQFSATGLPADFIDEKLPSLSTVNDRIKAYTYTNEGKLESTISGARHYFDPTKGLFYKTQGMKKNCYDAFGRVIDKCILVSNSGEEVWKHHYYWYDSGQTKPAFEAESFKGAINDPENLFKFSAFERDVFGNCVLKQEFNAPVPLSMERKSYSAKSIKEYLIKFGSPKDNLRRYEFTTDNQEQEVEFSGVLNLEDESMPTTFCEFQGQYNKNGKLVLKTDPNSFSEYVFEDPRGQALAKIGLPVISDADENGNYVFQYPLTHYLHNAHKEEVGSIEYVLGTEKPLHQILTEKPEPIGLDPEKDFVTLNLVDKRGLAIIKQEGKKQTALTYTPTKMEARKFVARLSDIHSNETRCIDEQRRTLNNVNQVIGDDNYRNGVRDNEHSLSIVRNTWEEEEEKYYLHNPDIKSKTKWSQGHVWYTEQGKNIPTLQFRNMDDDITLSVTAHDDVLRQFENEQQALEFVTAIAENSAVLKDIKTYNFHHKVLRHQQPNTKENIKFKAMPFYSNRINHYTYDTSQSKTSFTDAKGATWLYKSNAFGDELQVKDPVIDSYVSDKDPLSGDLKCHKIQSAKLINKHYDRKRQMDGVQEGYFDVAKNQDVMRPASILVYAPNGHLHLLINAMKELVELNFHNALNLPVKIKRHGISTFIELTYQGKQVNALIFFGASVDTYGSNSKLKYAFAFDEKTNELIGIGIPKNSVEHGGGNYFANFRYNLVGFINVRQLPGGQITFLKKDALDKMVQIKSPIGEVANKRHPFSGHIEHIPASTAEGEFKNLYNGINLETEHRQISRDSIFNTQMNLVVCSGPQFKTFKIAIGRIAQQSTLELIKNSYVAEFKKSSKSDLLNITENYECDNNGNKISTIFSSPSGTIKASACYNAVYHRIEDRIEDQYVLRKYSTPLYNLAMTELEIFLDGGRSLILRLANSFDDMDRIVRNAVDATWAGNDREQFTALSPTDKQGGFNSYNHQGLLDSQKFCQKLIEFGFDDTGAMVDVFYSENGQRNLAKHLLHSAIGTVAHLLWNATSIDNSTFMTSAKRPVPCLNQNRYSFKHNQNFVQMDMNDSLHMTRDKTLIALPDGVTTKKISHEEFAPDLPSNEPVLYYKEHEFKCLNDLSPLATQHSSKLHEYDKEWPYLYHHLYIKGRNIDSAQLNFENPRGDNKINPGSLSQIQQFIFSEFKRINHAEVIKHHDFCLSWYRPHQKPNDVECFTNRYDTQLLVGIDDDYLGRISLTDIDLRPQENAEITVTGAFLKGKYSGEKFKGKYLIDVGTRAWKARAHEIFKNKVILDELSRDEQYSAAYKKGPIVENVDSYEPCAKISDPINEVGILEKALTPPTWQPLEEEVELDNPIFNNLRPIYAAMIPLLGDKNNKFKSGMLLPLAYGPKVTLKMGDKASIGMATQKAMNIGMPLAQSYYVPMPPKRESFWKTFVVVLASVAAAAVAPVLAGAMFHVEAATLSAALANGGVAFALDLGVNGVAYKTHLVSHFSVWDSVATGLTAGIGAYIGVAGISGEFAKKAGTQLSAPTLKQILTHALIANVNGQLAQMAQNKDYEFNVKSLLNTIVVTIARQCTGINLKTDSALGQAVLYLEQNVMFDMLGSAIQGNDINLTQTMARALGNSMGQYVGNATCHMIQSINQNQAQSKLEGATNTAPSSDKDERRLLENSQPRFNEKKQQDAILAAYGEFEASNDAFFGHENYMSNFLQESFDNLSLDFHPETGEVSRHSLEARVHAPTLDKGRSASRVESKTATGKLSAYKQENAKSKSTLFGESRFGLFSNNESNVQKSAMLEAESFLLEQQKTTACFRTPSDMVKSATFNFVKNTIVTEAKPIIKDALVFTKTNLEVGTILIGGAGAKLGYESMSVGSRVLAGKALIGSTQGYFGAVATGSDFFDSVFGGVVGAALGSINIPGIGAYRFSNVTESAITSGISNLSGQAVSAVRSPEQAKLNPISLGFSIWAGGFSGFITKEINVSVSKAIIESTIQEPINAIGAHIWR